MQQKISYTIREAALMAAQLYTSVVLEKAFQIVELEENKLIISGGGGISLVDLLKEVKVKPNFILGDNYQDLSEGMLYEY